MKKNVGLFNVLLFFMIVLAIFFILHFGGVIFLRLSIGRRYAKDGEITKSEAVSIAIEYAQLRNFLQLWKRYHIVSNVYTWDAIRDGEVWKLTTIALQQRLGRDGEYVILIHAENGVIIESGFTGYYWQI